MQFGEVQPQAFVVAAAEGNPLVKVLLVFGTFVAEAFWIEGGRVAPVFFHVMGVERGHVDQGVFGQGVALVFHILDGAAGEGGQCRAHTQGLAEYPAGFFHFPQVVIVQSVLAQPFHFVDQHILPVRVFGQHVDNGAQGAGSGVVGGEQQEDHVVHHVLIGKTAFLVCRLAQFAEEIRGIAGAFLRDKSGDKILQIAAALHAPVPQQAGDRQAHNRQGGVGGVDKRLVYLVGFRAHFQAKKDLCAHVQ